MKIYFFVTDPYFLTIVILLGIATYAFYISIAGQSIFRKGFLEVS